MSKRTTVLFVESGRLGGGSFEGLRLMMTALDLDCYRPVVVFLSRTHFMDTFLEMGIPTYLFRDLVCSLDVSSRLQKWMERIQEYTYCRIPPLGKLAAAMCHRGLLCNLERVVREEQVDLLYSNNQINRNLFMPILAERVRLPLVVHLRSAGTESFCAPKREYVEHWVTRFLAISSRVKKHWQRGGLTAKVDLIPNGLPDFEVTPLDIAQEFSVPKNHMVVAILGRVVWEKAHLFLFDAFKELLKKRPDVSLLVVGDGPKREDLEVRLKELELGANVIMAGYDDRAKEIIAGVDLVVQPSMTDSFSRVIMEAMRLGIPTAITNKGSALEAVEPGVHSLVMAYEDVEALASAMELGLFDEQVRATLVREGRKLMDLKFDLIRQTRKVEAVMEAALKEFSGVNQGQQA